MAIEFNIDVSKNWFLGEDKFLSFTIFGRDKITPIDVSEWTMEWVLRKTDAGADPALLLKVTPTDIQVVGEYNVDPTVNTQRVRIFFSRTDTSLLRATTYRHSLKRIDPGYAGILSFGNCTFRQATAH
jgi:hypothetical protein